MPVILGGNTGIYLASLTPAVDPDAQAFITAAAITDPTQQDEGGLSVCWWYSE